MADLITLADAKAQLRVRSDDEDALIQTAIVDAQGWVEDYTGLILADLTPVPPNLLRAMRVLIVGYFFNRATGGLDAGTIEAAKRLCSNKKRWSV